MPVLSHPAFGPRVALVFVTIGSLMDVWVAVWYFTFVRGTEAPNITWFWLLGLFFTGLTLVFIGLLLGRIGRAARQAELPPSEALMAEANIQKTAAANPPPMVAGMPGVGVGQPAGTPPGVAAPTANPAMPAPAAPPAGR
jgi:hypothetical protein